MSDQPAQQTAEQQPAQQPRGGRQTAQPTADTGDTTGDAVLKGGGTVTARHRGEEQLPEGQSANPSQT